MNYTLSNKASLLKTKKKPPNMFQQFHEIK